MIDFQEYGADLTSSAVALNFAASLHRPISLYERNQYGEIVWRTTMFWTGTHPFRSCRSTRCDECNQPAAARIHDWL